MWICPDKPQTADESFFSKIKESDFVCQAKADGWRMVSTNEQKSIKFGEELKTFTSATFFSRTHILMEQALKAKIEDEFYKAMESLGIGIFDGEYTSSRRSKLPEMIYLFDIFSLNNELLLNVPYIDRWGMLENLYKEKLAGHPLIQLIPMTFSDFTAFYNLQKKNPAMEGVVLKKKKSTITGNRTDNSVDNKEWFKVKW